MEKSSEVCKKKRRGRRVKRPLVWVSAGWIAGVFAARGWNAFFFYGCAAVLVALAGGWIVYHYRKGRVVLFLLLGLFAGAFRYAWDVANNVSHLPRQFLNSPQVAIGKVVSLPDIEGDQLTFEMMVFDVKTDRGWCRVIPERVLSGGSCILTTNGNKPGG